MLNRIMRIFRSPADRLTPTEWEIVIAICELKLDTEATAERLYIQRNSVGVGLSRIYSKLGVRGIPQLREWYNENYPPLGLNYRNYIDE